MAVNERTPNTLTKTLAAASVVEIGTGLALMFDPSLVAGLLLGEDVAGVGVLLGRCFGAALFALGLACWPSEQHSSSASAAFRAMVPYNGLIAAYLAYLGIVGHVRGLLLWPAVLLHAVVAGLLVWTWREERKIEAAKIRAEMSTKMRSK